MLADTHLFFSLSTRLSASLLPLCLSVDGLTEADQLAVQQIMADLDVKQTTRMFQTIANVAFKDCVTSFRGKQLEKAETKCIENMVGKYMAHFQRINIRFGEEFVNMTQQATAAAQQQEAANAK